MEIGDDAEDRRQDDGGRSEYRHDPRELGVADLKRLGERRQCRLDKVDAHHQGDTRCVDDAQGARLFGRELLHAKQRG